MTFQYIWPKFTPTFYKNVSEAIILFEYLLPLDNKQLEFPVASNYPYELYLDHKFINDGGHRCPNKEAYIDNWTLEPGTRNICIRLHWLNPHLTSVYFRCLFSDPFVAISSDLELTHWICRLDPSIKFAAKINTQLPCQNWVIDDMFGPYDDLTIENWDRSYWKLIPLPVQKCRYVPVSENLNNNIIKKITLLGQKEMGKMDESKVDLHTFVVDQRPNNMKCVTYDLGKIGLHRFEYEPVLSKNPELVVFCYSEVKNFTTAWLTNNRRKVHMADGFSYQGLSRCFGQRGCRYLHIINTSGDYEIKSKIRVWRREYPFEFKIIKKPGSMTIRDIMAACRNNLIACVDGGLVDTCWRERAQWTGDARMSIMALNALTNNPEIGEFVLHQISLSYDSKYAMVCGVFPTKTPSYFLAMPTFHLAFALLYCNRKMKNSINSY